MTEEVKKNQYEAAQGYMLLAVLLKTVGGYPSSNRGTEPSDYIEISGEK